MQLEKDDCTFLRASFQFSHCRAHLPLSGLPDVPSGREAGDAGNTAPAPALMKTSVSRTHVPLLGDPETSLPGCARRCAHRPWETDAINPAVQMRKLRLGGGEGWKLLSQYGCYVLGPGRRSRSAGLQTSSEGTPCSAVSRKGSLG